MFRSFKPGARPKSMWMAITVIAAIAVVGLVVMFAAR
jgi:hypothetical protein